MRLIFLCAILLLNAVSSAQIVKPPALPASLGLTASGKRFDDPFSALVNPASLALAQELQAGICSELKFLEKDLRFINAAVAFPVQSGGMAINIDYLGTDGFNQSRIGAGYSKKLGSKLSLGIGLDYHRLLVQGYGSRQALTARLGFQYIISDKLTLFVATDNPAGGKLGKSPGEKLASTFSAGLGNQVSEKTFISGVARKEEGHEMSLYFLFNYLLHEYFTVFAGISVGDSAGFFGSSVRVRKLRFLQSIGWKQSLGFSPSLTIIFQKPEME